MPELDEVAYLANWWLAVGPATRTGMGAAPLAPSEILAWQAGTGRRLAGWEFQQLIDMSEAYLAELHEAEAPERAPPFGEVRKDPAKVSASLGDALRAMARARRKK